LSFYDTGEYYLTGAAQQQSGTQTLTFTAEGLPVPLSSLKRMYASEG
jgi:hypothetical protein